MKTSTPSVLITFALVSFALFQNTQAVSPAPDGGYPRGNTAEGQNALLSLTTDSNTTANDNTTNGIYKTLVLLSHMDGEVLKPHVAEIKQFSQDMEGIGPNIEERARVLRSRLQLRSSE